MADLLTCKKEDVFDYLQKILNTGLYPNASFDDLKKVFNSEAIVMANILGQLENENKIFQPSPAYYQATAISQNAGCKVLYLMPNKTLHITTTTTDADWLFRIMDNDNNVIGEKTDKKTRPWTHDGFKKWLFECLIDSNNDKNSLRMAITRVCGQLANMYKNVNLDAVCDGNNKPSQPFEMCQFSEDIKVIHPSLDFSDGHMYVGALYPLQQENGITSDEFIIIRDDKKYYHFNPDKTEPLLIDDKLQLKIKPFKRRGYFTRWHHKSIYEFINTDILVDKILLYEKINNVFKAYSDLYDKRLYAVITCWTIGTYLHKLFYTYPYFVLYGRPNCGKTNTLTIMQMLSFNGCNSVGISPPALYRSADAYSISLFIDENRLFQPLKHGIMSSRLQELEQLFHARYKQGQYIQRLKETANKDFEDVEFMVYGPTAFATNYEPTWILGTRCLINMMKRKTGSNEISQPKTEDPIWQEIRNMLYIFAMQNFNEIKVFYDTLQPPQTLDSRDWELAKPMFAVAKAFGNDVFNDVCSYLEELVVDKKHDEEIEDRDYLVLEAVWTMGIWGEWIHASDIMERIIQLHNDKYGYQTIQGWINSTWAGRKIKEFLSGTYDKGNNKLPHRGICYRFYKDKVRDSIERFMGKNDERMEVWEKFKEVKTFP